MTKNPPPLRVGTICSGYDSQCMALDRLHEFYPSFSYELMFWCEIDKYAIQAHNAVYPQWADRNIGDLTKAQWDTVPHVDLFTYSTPCTDISAAGQQRGLEEGSGTRSSILWCCRDAIRTLRPKYLLMENVKALTQKKFLPFFLKWQKELADMGYTNHARVLNATDFGVPQNRERVFMVSILGEDSSYNWPSPFPLTRCIEDILEPEEDVDPRYFLRDERVQGLLESTLREQEAGRGYKFSPKKKLT